MRRRKYRRSEGERAVMSGRSQPGKRWGAKSSQPSARNRLPVSVSRSSHKPYAHQGIPPEL